MSVNSSSSLNATLSFYLTCLKSTGSNVIWITLTSINILFIPLYVLILHMGFQRWRLAGHKTSHSDFFTYHAVTMEIIGAFGCLVYTFGIFTHSEMVLILGIISSFIIFLGPTFFHLLTCVDRYLAVVHPVNYMRFRETGGCRIRNISILCAWLMCFGWMGITKLYLPAFPFIPLICMLSVSVIVISFCCLSVLRVLKHPRPGVLGGDKEQVDQSKRRAFRIVLVIMGALLLRFAGLLIVIGLSFLLSISIEDVCALVDFGILLGLPSSLVLPLLFLHKSEKLACCRYNPKSN